MRHIEQLVEAYRQALAQLEGEEVAHAVEVRWSGGDHVVIRHRDTGEDEILGVGTFTELAERLLAEARAQAA